MNLTLPIGTIPSNYGVANAGDTPPNLDQLMSPECGIPIGVQPLTHGESGLIWRVETLIRPLILRRAKSSLTTQDLEQPLFVAQEAGKLGIAPRILCWHAQLKTALIEFVEPDPSLEECGEFARLSAAVLQLKRLHDAMRGYLHPNSIKTAEFPWSVLFPKNEVLERGFPPELITALYRVAILFNEIKPWLIQHATLIHGDLKPSHVLYTRQKSELVAKFIDFEACSIGHPYFDLARLTAESSEEQRDRLLALYTGKAEIPDQNKRHLQLCLIAVQLQSAIYSYSKAQNKLAQLDRGLNSRELQGILNSSLPCPLTRCNGKPSDAVLAQMVATWTLRDVLQKTQPLLGDRDRQAIDDVVAKLQPPSLN